MIEVKSPKVSWISTPRVEFLKGGLYDGALALSLCFSGHKVIPAEAAACLASFLALRLPSTKIVRISGEFPDNDDNFVVFLKSFQKYGFKLVVVANNDKLSTWMDSVDWLVVRTATPLLMIQPNEVWYEPEGEAITDLTMPQLNGKMTFFYLSRNKNIDVTEDFFCRSNYHWQLV